MAFNFGSALTSGLSGAGTGAALGNFIPGVGTGIGAIGGGILGLLSSLWGNQGSEQAANMSQLPDQGLMQIPRFSPGQMQTQDLLRSLAENRIAQLLGGGASGMENQALSQFNQQIIPSIAERFTSMGAQNSSAFQQALSQAGAGLSERLAGMREQQANRLLPSLLQVGLTPQYEQIYQPPQEEAPGFWRSIAPGLASGVGMAGGAAGLYGLQKLLGGG